MTILHLPNIHNQHRQPRTVNADTLVHFGNFTMNGSRQEVTNFAKLRHPHGNCQLLIVHCQLLKFVVKTHFTSSARTGRRTRRAHTHVIVPRIAH